MAKTILVALDVNDAEGAARVADVAKRLAASEGAVLHAMTVVPDSGMAIVSSYLGPEHSGKMLEEGGKGLAAFAADHLPDVSADNLHAVQGTIYDKILATASAVGADLIVIGAHRPELKDYLIGPNAARVARHAAQSVYVVR